jgi:Phage integrase, N-terminal SAM-like domain
VTDRRREIDRGLWSPPATVEQKTAKRRADQRSRQYSDRWLETRTVRGRPLRPRTRAHYRKLVDDHILPTFGAKPLAGITMLMAARWYAKTLAAVPTRGTRPG